MVASALGKFRVIDLSTEIAGPYAGRLFADYGSDVVKVEPVSGGDPARKMGPFHQDDPHPEKCLLFLCLNCNKRGVTLNLETDAGEKNTARPGQDGGRPFGELHARLSG